MECLHYSGVRLNINTISVPYQALQYMCLLGVRCHPDGHHVKKIIFINRYFYPDVSATSQMLTDLAVDIAGRGYSVEVVTSRQSYQNPSESFPASENVSGVKVRRIWTTRFGRSNLLGRSLDYLAFYFSALFALIRVVNRSDIVVAKTDPPLISVIAWVVVRLKGAKLVNWLQDIFPEVASELGFFPNGVLFKLTKKVRDASLRSASLNVVLGGRMYERVCSLGVKPSMVKIVHNWSDGDMIRPVSRDKNILRSEWGMEGKFVVGYSGNMGRAHDFDTIISTMVRLRENEDIVFLFIGGGAGKRIIEEAVHCYGLKNCIFMPYQARERLAESLSVPDVHLVSLHPQMEGLIVPSKVYGIAASGRPVIFVGDKDGEVARMIYEIGCGAVVGPGESELLSNRIVDYSMDIASVDLCGSKMRKSFERNYDKRNAINAWVEILEEL